MAKACGFSANGEIMTLPTPEAGPKREQHGECELHPPRMEPHTFFLNNFGAQLSQRRLGLSMPLPLCPSPSQKLLLLSEADRGCRALGLALHK